MDDFEKKYFSLRQTSIINLLFLIFIIWINFKSKELENSETYNLSRYIFTMKILVLAILIVELALYLILWKNI